MNPLTLADTEALITELFIRFDHAVFAGQVKHSTENDQEVFRANGNRRQCQGLCIGAISTIERAHLDDARPVKEEDV